MNLFMITDDLDAAVAHLEAHTVGPFGLKRRQPSSWLGERGLSSSADSPTPSGSQTPRP
jgi:hypothetical protein